MEYFDIVIIDTGVYRQHPYLEKETIHGIAIGKKDNDGYYVQDDINDNYGHGTGIYSIIKKQCERAHIFVIKLISENKDTYEMESDLLYYALMYVEQNIDCKLINISLGLKAVEDVYSLEHICEVLRSKGSIIFSAFDNDGTLSYPACLSSVIGVDCGEECSGPNEFGFVEESPINILAYGKRQRVLWQNPNYIIASGSSYACAYATAYAYKIMNEKDLFNSITILKEFEKISKVQYRKKRRNLPAQAKGNIKIQKAILFPFNKEMHSLFRYKEMLNFDIINIYDVRFSGNVGVKVSKLLNIEEGISDYEIQNIDHISFEGVDTLILGHVGKLAVLLKDDTFVETLIKKVLDRGIQIFTFDSLPLIIKRESDLFHSKKIFWNEVTSDLLPTNRFGRMYRIFQPVLGIFGTSSKQGKFSLQLILRKKLCEMGYQVGQLGTEPSSLLYDMDEIYPMGYASAISLHEHEAILYLNEAMHRISQKEKDLIIVGGQSNVVTTTMNQIGAFPCRQINFILATQPDAVILNINPYDEFEYIERTIKFMESICLTKVIALVMFPMDLKDDWTGTYGNKVVIGEEKYQSISKQLSHIFGLPIYKLGNEEHMKQLIDTIIEFF